MIYSACELLPTCNKLENPGVRKSHYSASDRSWRTWKVTPRYGLHIISLWTLLGHIRIYHCALQIEHKRTTEKNSMENDQVPLEPASIYCNHISSTCSTLITAWHESTVFLFWDLCPSVLWVLDLQASLIATILSNGSTAESIVKASWEATRAARHNSSVACSNPIPLVLSTPHSMVAILRKFSNYKTMVSGCFWEVFNNRGKGLFPWHVAHLANYWVMHQTISKTWCPIAHRKQNWIHDDLWTIYGCTSLQIYGRL